MGFDKLLSDDCVTGRGSVWMWLFVDDIILLSPNMEDAKRREA